MQQFLLQGTDSNGSCLGKKVHWEENTFLSGHWLPYSTPTLVPWLVKWVLYNYKLLVLNCLNELLLRFFAWKAQTTIIIVLSLFTDPSFTKKLRVKQGQGWVGRRACWLAAASKNKTTSNKSSSFALQGKHNFRRHLLNQQVAWKELVEFNHLTSH